MYRIAILFILMTLPNGTSAQVGFLGKRFTFTAGTSIAPPISNHTARYSNPLSEHKVVVFYDWAVLPPELRLNVDAVLTERIQFSLSGKWRGLQNCGFYSHNSESTPTGSNYYVDSFMLKTNAIGLTGSFKFFAEYAPVGRYIEVGGGITRSVSDVYPTYSVRNTNYVTEIETTISNKWEPGVYISNNFHVNFAIGKTSLITRDLVLDYGIKSSYFFGAQKYQPVDFNYGDDPINYQDSFSEMINYLQFTNLKSSYAIEIYLNFGISL